MKNRTDFIGVGVKDETKQTMKTYQEGLRTILWSIVSFIVALGNMLMEISPFGVAICAACPRRKLFPVMLGVIAGNLMSASILPRGAAMSMKYVAAVLIVGAVRWGLSSGTLLKEFLYAAPVLSSVSLLLPSLAMMIAGSFTVYDIVMTLAESIMAGACTYFMLRTIKIFQLGQGVLTLKRSDTACMIISICMFIVSLSSITVGNLSIGRIAASFLVMLCALMGGETTAAVAGIACGVSVGMALFPHLNLLGTFALAGLAAGVFSPLGKFGCAAAFVMTSGALNILTGQSMGVLPMLIETLISSGIFMLFPQKYMKLIKTKVFRHIDRTGDKGVKDLLLARMSDASAALKDIADTTQKVSKKLDKMKAANIGEVYSNAIDEVCQKCGLKTRCWQQEYNDSIAVFNNMTYILRKTGQVSEEDFGYPLTARCGKKDKLAEKINAGYQEFVSKEGMSRKVARVRSVVTDQFEGMSDMLEGFARELCEVTSFDNRLTLKVLDYLERMSLDAVSVNCYRDDQEKVFIQLYLPRFKLARVDKEEITEDLSQICDCVLALPEEVMAAAPGGSVTAGETVRLTFQEAAEFTMETAASQHICQGANLCGDSFSTFTNRRCVSHMLISDGMGSGTAAAVDSAMTVSLISKLIDADVGYEPSLKIVNSALLVKSGEESLSTIDMTAVDLYTGVADFYKAGAAPTFVKRGNKTGFVESTSLPVGILTAVDFEKSSLKLSPGDLIVMVSDGAVAAGTDWIRSTIEKYQDGDDLKKLCDDIAATAKLKRNDSHDDDITVVAGVLREA